MHYEYNQFRNSSIYTISFSKWFELYMSPLFPYSSSTFDCPIVCIIFVVSFESHQYTSKCLTLIHEWSCCLHAYGLFYYSCQSFRHFTFYALATINFAYSEPLGRIGDCAQRSKKSWENKLLLYRDDCTRKSTGESQSHSSPSVWKGFLIWACSGSLNITYILSHSVQFGKTTRMPFNELVQPVRSVIHYLDY